MFTKLIFKEFLLTPKNIGAVVPTSNTAAKTLCSMLPRKKKFTMCEIGPGTGALTKELIKYITPEEFYLMERSVNLYNFLQDSYPNLHVMNIDAKDMQRYLPSNMKFDVIVSSMPLLTLPKEYREAILQSFHTCLKKRGRLLFLSYNFFCNKEILEAGFTHRHYKRVFRNIPPARIDLFTNT